MKLYPAIDLKDGKCIRLVQGKIDKITYYNPNPLNQAQEFEKFGADWIHMVDIDGAFKGTSLNHEIFIKIKKKTKCLIQVGGGIRNEKTVNNLLENNIDRIVLGTLAVDQPDLVKSLCKKYPDKIAIGLDSKNGFIRTEGWSRKSQLTLTETVKTYENYGVSRIIFTDIEKDGLLSGVSFKKLENLLELTKIKIIASGGVSNLGDIKKLKKLSLIHKNLDGIIVGRAIYEKKLEVNEALRILKRC